MTDIYCSFTVKLRNNCLCRSRSRSHTKHKHRRQKQKEAAVDWLRWLMPAEQWQLSVFTQYPAGIISMLIIGLAISSKGCLWVLLEDVSLQLEVFRDV